jgi:hypothetical protein
MTFVILWIATVAAVFSLGYSFGRQAGLVEGRLHGFQGALERAIEVQRPLNLLRRILLPNAKD